MTSPLDLMTPVAGGSGAQSRPPRGREGEVLASAYRLDKLLASGGMGEIYRATYFGAQGAKQVAVKVLHRDFVANTEVVVRFLREARASNAVRHPNVVSVLDVGQDASGAPFLVQELLEGMDLSAWAEKKGGVVTPRAAVAVVLPIARALTVAHAVGVVHRDVKPDNVFLARGGDGRIVPKLVDFGISRVITDEKSNARLTANAPMGTPAYMAPEQARSARDVDGRADVWSSGVLLYELLTGKLPFDATNPNQMIAAIVTSDPRPIEQIAPDLPRSVIAVVQGCLVRSRDARFTAEQLVAALEIARDDVGGSARASGGGTASLPPSDDVASDATDRHRGLPANFDRERAHRAAVDVDPLAFPLATVAPHAAAALESSLRGKPIRDESRTMPTLVPHARKGTAMLLALCAAALILALLAIYFAVYVRGVADIAR